MLYGSLQPILISLQPFCIIAIDFIVTRSIYIPEGYNTIITITDKFSKGLGLIAGRDN